MPNTRRGLKRDQWIDLARSLDWELSYVDERQAFPAVPSGRPWLANEAWRDWDEPHRTSYGEYVETQHAKEVALNQLRAELGRVENFERLDRAWLSAIKLHAATLPLAEFAAVVSNLRAGRFDRTSAWRTTAIVGALDELRHTQLPLLMMHELVRWQAPPVNIVESELGALYAPASDAEVDEVPGADPSVVRGTGPLAGGRRASSQASVASDVAATGGARTAGTGRAGARG